MANLACFPSRVSPEPSCRETPRLERGVAGQGGPSGGGKRDGARGGAAENEDGERGAGGHCEGIRRTRGKAQSRPSRREPNDLSLHIAD